MNTKLAMLLCACPALLGPTGTDLRTPVATSTGLADENCDACEPHYWINLNTCGLANIGTPPVYMDWTSTTECSISLDGCIPSQHGTPCSGALMVVMPWLGGSRSIQETSGTGKYWNRPLPVSPDQAIGVQITPGADEFGVGCGQTYSETWKQYDVADGAPGGTVLCTLVAGIECTFCAKYQH